MVKEEVTLIVTGEVRACNTLGGGGGEQPSATLNNKLMYN